MMQCETVMPSLRTVLGDRVKQVFSHMLKVAGNKTLTPLLLLLGFRNVYHCTIWGDPNRVILGKNVDLKNVLLNVASGRIIIGDNVLIGHHTMLITGTHDYHKVGRKRQRTFPKFGRDIVIEEGAWIASGTIVLGGVTIGRNAVVGAGSLVNDDVEPDTLVAGIPASFIRKLRYGRARGQGRKSRLSASSNNDAKAKRCGSDFIS